MTCSLPALVHYLNYIAVIITSPPTIITTFISKIVGRLIKNGKTCIFQPFNYWLVGLARVVLKYYSVVAVITVYCR